MSSRGTADGAAANTPIVGGAILIVEAATIIKAVMPTPHSGILAVPGCSGIIRLPYNAIALHSYCLAPPPDEAAVGSAGRHFKSGSRQIGSDGHRIPQSVPLSLRRPPYYL